MRGEKLGELRVDSERCDTNNRCPLGGISVYVLCISYVRVLVVVECEFVHSTRFDSMEGYGWGLANRIHTKQIPTHTPDTLTHRHQHNTLRRTQRHATYLLYACVAMSLPFMSFLLCCVVVVVFRRLLLVGSFVRLSVCLTVTHNTPVNTNTKQQREIQPHTNNTNNQQHTGKERRRRF